MVVASYTFYTRRIYFSLSVSLWLVAWAAMSPAQTTDHQADHLLRVEGDHNYHPYNFLDEQGSPAGFTVELIWAISEVMGLNIEIQLGPWDEVHQNLQENRLDIVLGMYSSPERDLYADFSSPLMIATHAIFVRENSPIRSLRDLRGKEILIQTGDIMHDFVAEKGLTDRIMPQDEHITALRLLAAGHHDAALLGKLPGLYWARKYQLANIKTVGGPIEARKFCFAVSEGDDVLLALLNEGLSILKATGRYEQIHNRWFGVYEENTLASDILREAVWFLLPVMLLLVAAFAWNWSLQRTVAKQTEELSRELGERRRIEHALRDSEEMARAILNAASESIFLLDREGVVLDINEAAVQRLGVADTFVGKNLLDFFPPELAAARKAKVEAVLHTGKPVRFEDERDGFVFQVTACPVCDESGDVTRVAIYAKDVTEQKRAQAVRSRLEAQVLHAQKMESLGVLAGGVAHDFNNLLMGILGNVDLALADLSTDQSVRESLQEIQTAANRAADLCRQMLAYSGKGRFVIQSLDLSQLVGEMTQLLGVSISKNVSLEYDCDANLPPVEGDATQIRQVIMNLITNASDAIGEGTGVIRVGTGVKMCEQEYLRTITLGEDLPVGEYAYIEVSDNGCGMDNKTCKRIFEPFFSTKFTGRGLGLAAVLGIVRGHQGALHVNSELDRGTVFQVLFPVSEQTDEVFQAGQKTPLPPSGCGTILVVDDEDAVRALAAHMLEKLGYEVLTAADGHQGIRIFKERHSDIDAVVLDLTMPHFNGEETFYAMREIDPQVRVVLSSRYNEAEILAELVPAGRVNFIQKPFQLTLLGEKLRQVLA